MANLFDSEPRTVYERVVLLRRSSIDALVDLVPPQAEVLDVGVGDGASASGWCGNVAASSMA